ncbi:thioredoxin [Candidatus Falkowbacteria bacterium RIFCSPLOWO2_12_FULL_45_13]|uniref:Thioredoxin n=1 Tax=Candidatus Falkowbacteria bacterium RIFCSPLOWO2_12_FULL_45_13 TaxID=1797991 RepID=A0A1F5SWF2_9BACT|nr:MAG: thioredoxin [Candidatus Falkowbacteria bacterium RIFCSPLOWO2_12_FULL_45_13]
MIFNKDNFKQEVEENAGVVLVDFFAAWCGPCQMMAPIIDEMIKENKDQNIKIGKVNIDDDQSIAVKYNVMSIPTFLIFKKGKVNDRISGYCSKDDLIQLIDKNK